jgi:hypothetical protein
LADDQPQPSTPSAPSAPSQLVGNTGEPSDTFILSVSAMETLLTTNRGDTLIYCEANERLQLKVAASEYFQAWRPFEGGAGTAIYRDSLANGSLDTRDELIPVTQNYTPHCTDYLFT